MLRGPRTLLLGFYGKRDELTAVTRPRGRWVVALLIPRERATVRCSLVQTRVFELPHIRSAELPHIRSHVAGATGPMAARRAIFGIPARTLACGNRSPQR